MSKTLFFTFYWHIKYCKEVQNHSNRKKQNQTETNNTVSLNPFSQARVASIKRDDNSTSKTDNIEAQPTEVQGVQSQTDETQGSPAAVPSVQESSPSDFALAIQRSHILLAYDLKLRSRSSTRLAYYNKFLNKALQFTYESSELEWVEAIKIVQKKEPIMWDLILKEMPKGHHLNYPTYLKQMMVTLNCNSDQIQGEWTAVLSKKDPFTSKLPEEYKRYQKFVDENLDTSKWDVLQGLACVVGAFFLIWGIVSFLIWLV